MGASTPISGPANAAIGAIGSACILLAYVLITFSAGVARLTGWRPGPDTYTYHSLNLVGGTLAAAAAYLTEDVGAIPLGVLETIWAAIAIGGLAQIAWRRWRVPIDDERAKHGGGGTKAASGALPSISAGPFNGSSSDDGGGSGAAIPAASI